MHCSCAILSSVACPAVPYSSTLPPKWLNADNNHQTHLQERIKNANKTYCMLQNFFENKNISKKLKLILKNTIIDKTLTYALETSTLTKRDRKQLNIFRGKCIEEF